MRRWQRRTAWNSVTAAAFAAVVGLASPAAAAEPSTTTVQASPSSVAVGQPVTLTATVICPGDPSGGVGMTFWDGGDMLNTVPVGAGGQATYTAEFSAIGSHTITAAYNGNDNCFASNNTTTVQVTETPTPPTPPGGGLCLLVCGPGIINFSTGDIHNEIR